MGAVVEVGILAIAMIASIAACWRWRFLTVPSEASGRIPVDPPIGALAMLSIYVLGIICASVVSGVLPESTRSDPDWSRLILGVLANTFQCVGAIGFLVSRLAVQGPRACATTPRALKEGAIGFIVVVPLVFAVAAMLGALLPVFGLPKAPEVSHKTLEILRAKSDALFTWTTLAHVVVLVPLAEELLWRGLMQPSMRAVGLPPMAAILATSALFAAIHWTSIPDAGRVTGLAMLVLLSTALGILRDRTGGVLAPALAHGLFNAMNVAMALRS
jgi:membrane protease YdiL (CAAX protease family)